MIEEDLEALIRLSCVGLDPNLTFFKDNDFSLVLVLYVAFRARSTHPETLELFSLHTYIRLVYRGSLQCFPPRFLLFTIIPQLLLLNIGLLTLKSKYSP